jgi:hypothetical protein
MPEANWRKFGPLAADCSDSTNLCTADSSEKATIRRPLLYIRGNIELLKRDRISVTSARRRGHFGNQMAARISSKLARPDVMLKSGLVREMSRIFSTELLESTAALFDREPESVIRQLPGEQFLKVLL